jgi:DNA-binding SARP family transcriptional activator
MNRSAAAERLWPDSHHRRAAANLRSALWLGRRIGDVTVIETSGPRLLLATAVEVDTRAVMDQARRMARTTDTPVSPSGPEVLITNLSRELLPDWSDEWLLLERERWDQVRLHTLETLARRLIATKMFLSALEAALTAVAIEPVRESAHRALVEVYLAEGNSACALKHYQRYRALLHRELGVTPSQRLTDLVCPKVSV